MIDSLKGKHLLTLKELSRNEIEYLVNKGISYKLSKSNRSFSYDLKNRNICGIFLKPSTRTRASFVVAASDEGAHFELFSADDIRFGEKESISDIARVMGSLFDGIAFRGFNHSHVEEIAKNAGVPVWNCLTDDHHPTQIIADLMTIKESFGRLDDLKIGYIGDGTNNVLTSLAIACLKMGITLSIVSPPELQPNFESRSKIFNECIDITGDYAVTDDLEYGLNDCDVVYTDIWVSMGEDVDIHRRAKVLSGYRVTNEVLKYTRKSETIFLHCLPSLHNLDTKFTSKYPNLIDTDDDVFSGKHSRVFSQSENRMHTIKSIMASTLSR